MRTNGLKRLAVASMAVFALMLSLTQSANADVRFEIKSNYTGPIFVGGLNVLEEIRTIENQIEDMLVGWRGPNSVESRYTGLSLQIDVVGIDGPGMTLAQAGVSEKITYGSANGLQGALATSSFMEIDQDDMPGMIANGSFRNVIMHEMFHAIGSGTLWADFNLRDSTGLGYVGAHALDYYRRESGNTFAANVPLEPQGGGGTAGAHWSSLDPYFVDRVRRRAEIQTGFSEPSYDTFISNVTLAQFRDLGYIVPGLGGDDSEFGDDGLVFPTDGSVKPTGGNGGQAGGGGGTGNQNGDDGIDSGKGGSGPLVGSGTSGNGPVAVPEPSSALILLSLTAGFGLVGVRRRNA